MENHPVPLKYHSMFAIGERDRRGNIINFKIPPAIIDSTLSMEAFKSVISSSHVPAESLPLVYVDVKPFVVIRPSALIHVEYVKEEFIASGLCITEEVKLDNFLKFSDVLYQYDQAVSFHWKWRVIMSLLHSSGMQDQNNAVVLVLRPDTNAEYLLSVKKRIRKAIGETPVLVRYNNEPAIALGIHHLHSPDAERLPLEFNVLMHAKNKTSIFRGL